MESVIGMAQLAAALLLSLLLALGLVWLSLQGVFLLMPSQRLSSPPRRPAIAHVVALPRAPSVPPREVHPPQGPALVSESGATTLRTLS